MTPEEIRLEFFKRRKEMSFSSVARRLGVSRQAVSYVIDRAFVSRRIMEAVADALGKDKRYVFPEYYLKNSSQ